MRYTLLALGLFLSVELPGQRGSASAFGYGCGRLHGDLPSLRVVQVPEIGGHLGIEIRGLPPGRLGWLGWGDSNSNFNGLPGSFLATEGPLPLSLDELRMEGCELYVGGNLQFLWYSTERGVRALRFSIPDDPSLVGRTEFLQYVFEDPDANARGWAVTNAVEFTVGRPESPNAGLFLSKQNLDRARQRIASDQEPFAKIYEGQRARALRYLNATADPFHMEDMSTIVSAWAGDTTSNVDDSLRDAVEKFDVGSDEIRTLALEYALTGDARFGDKAVEMMLDWAERHTPVNVYDFNPDFQNATIDGITVGFTSDRPWNFALDTMWQTYGLTNASDAYLLLTLNGYELSWADRDAIQDWIRKVAEAVNSSFHAWTRWADAHETSPSFERYRSDNHLSWCHVGLLAAAAALKDSELQEYVLNGGSWTDNRSEPYENPSSVRDVINLAIESGTGSQHEGRVYEERILRDPPIGYSLFHLQAMLLVARIAQVHFVDDDSVEDVWSFEGEDSGGLRLAFERYTAFILGERQSPQPGERPSARSLYELVYAQWPSARFAKVINTTDRMFRFRQAIGPVTLLLGEILP